MLYIIDKKMHIFSFLFSSCPLCSCLFYCLFLSYSLSLHLFSYLPCLSFFPSPIFIHWCIYLLIQLTPLPRRVPTIWLGEQADGSSIATLFLLSKSVTCLGFFKKGVIRHRPKIVRKKHFFSSWGISFVYYNHIN